MSKSVCFGIDLGTTNSCISMMKSNTTIPTVIPLDDGLTIPSCVMLNEDGSLTVGKEAYEHRFEQSTIYSVKRLMGSASKVTLRNGDREVVLTPEEVSAEILKAIVVQAEKTVGKDIVKDVTITVPAHFNDTQRRATRRAGELAGLNVVGIINEPTSAGLLYGLDNAKSNQTILVYDLGGGTFDVSILRVTKELRQFPMLGINVNEEYNKTAINIIANEGDVKLGGDDIDNAVMDYVLDDLTVQSGLSPNKIKELISTRGLEELKLRLEKAKKAKQGLILYNLDGKEYTVKLSGDKYIKAYEPIFNRTYELVSQAMANAGIANIDHIVLVGGSTKSDIIRDMLKDKFPHINIMNTFEPDLSVALGASISSATSLGLSSAATITDVVPMSIGILSTDENGNTIFTKMLKKDTQLPCSAIKTFSILDTTKDVMLNIMQGESKHNIDSLVSIGKLILGSDKYQANELNVLFRCDLNGVLSCHVIIDNKEIDVAINYSANLTDSKSKETGYDELEKGERFFYDAHKRKLVKAGVSPDKLALWQPSVVKGNIDGAKELFNKLINS